MTTNTITKGSKIQDKYGNWHTALKVVDCAVYVTDLTMFVHISNIIRVINSK